MKLTPLLFLSLFYGLAQAKDPAAYFGGSGNEGYVAWLQGASYEKTVFLESSKDDTKGVALHWTIEGETIKLAVAAKATGWVAFGLGESGSMLGADMVLYTAESNELVDSYVLEQTIMPFRDECQSWTLVASTVKDEFIIFEASRLLDTGDTQDRAISDDPNDLIPGTRVLAAWGNSTTVSYHGDSNARGAIHFLGNSSVADELEAFQTAMENEAEGSFAILANNYTIPTDRTTYALFCLSREDILAMDVDLDQDLHIIGLEPIIDPRTKPYVHHFGVVASSLPFNSSLSCEEYPGVEATYIWAPGEAPMNLPSNVGSPLGSKGYQSFLIQIHYDNPKGVAGQIDASGVRMYYTSKKRQYDMGVFVNGDSNLEGELVSPYGGLAQHVFVCPGSCSSNSVKEPLTVFREQLHMHASGASAVNEQIRNNVVIRQGEVEYWDFRQQGNYAVPQESFTILPGDSFRTVCNYNAVNNETWGKGSENEMCSATLYYYPRQVQTTPIGDLAYGCDIGLDEILPGCGQTYEFTPDFAEARQLGRVFGTPSTTCSAVNGTNKPTNSATVRSMGYTSGILVLAASGVLALLW